MGDKAIACKNCVHYRPGYAPWGDVKGKRYGTCRWRPNEAMDKDEGRPKCLLFQAHSEEPVSA